MNFIFTGPCIVTCEFLNVTNEMQLSFLVQIGKELADLYTKGHRHRVTYTRCIDTIDSPDDEHEVARNMYRIEIIIKKRIVRQVGHLPRIITRRTVNKI